MAASTIAARVARHTRNRGVLPVLTDCLAWGARWAVGRPLAGRPATATFAHDGSVHSYLRHPYNWTWLNERAVEVPLAAAVLAGAGGQRVLEVGNVLAHYQHVAHTVVDKYEQAPGVLNEDVAELTLTGPYDLILAVSTLEHVGLDEDVRDPDKPARAIARLTALLAPGGRLWCTFPVGYNPDLDRQLRSGELGFTRLSALRRTGPANRWEQVPLESVWDVDYDWLLYTAHAVVVAELTR
ncbi:class I SAM-dependent methyltransferase [Blastococcus sp. LR1]|uniref:class I SAM-dependent methyltransferase n=1 Tax=Blastococcus sp. LR1 TaxID=2877000 RepID=UPI001CCF12D6|nr:class I SAM-dependent methyltransferase [Blastococcus sp. LR1]MCA0145153.1 class I SAM-dependent methyltransferase [Blastococcus sp. LR1]